MQCSRNRARGRPQIRWIGDIKRYVRLAWKKVAQNSEGWKRKEEAYIQKLIEEG